jgi:hypothetical protein
VKPGDVVQCLGPPATWRGRKGTILRVNGDDDRYSSVKVMWHPHRDFDTEVQRIPAAWLATHSTILCKVEDKAL